MLLPPLDFRVGCECDACQLAIMLWYGDERTHPRPAWTDFWEKMLAHHDVPVTQVCLWQRHNFAHGVKKQRALRGD